MVDRGCSVTTDQGGEFARLKHRYAHTETVNHRIEWVTAEGVTTNLGETYNGILKQLGRALNIWRGGPPRPTQLTDGRSKPDT